VVDRAALLALVPDQHVLPVEKQDVELLDLVVGDMGRAVVDQPVPRVDHRLLLQLAAHQPQHRLTRRLDRGDAGEVEPGSDERFELGAHDLGKPAEMFDQRFRHRLYVAELDGRV
jgi:hypothetical protein